MTTVAGAMSRSRSLLHLDRLEAEAIFIMREAGAEARRSVMLFSAGKDSTVMAHVALRAFYPTKPPFPLLHIDSTWEFHFLLDFRDTFARDHGFNLIVHANEEDRTAGLNPFDHGERYTAQMRTEPLKAALDSGGYDLIFGGARRDEEKSRVKERKFSIRGSGHGWEPRPQRPEVWNLYNTRLAQGQTVRVFPQSDWTEADIGPYALRHKLAPAPLFFAASRSVVERSGSLIAVDDEVRMRWRPGETATRRQVRFRTLGCWPVTAAVDSAAADRPAIVRETFVAAQSERQGRIGDSEDGGSLEQKKREGYF